VLVTPYSWGSPTWLPTSTSTVSRSIWRPHMSRSPSKRGARWTRKAVNRQVGHTNEGSFGCAQSLGVTRPFPGPINPGSNWPGLTYRTVWLPTRGGSSALPRLFPGRQFHDSRRGERNPRLSRDRKATTRQRWERRLRPRALSSGDRIERLPERITPTSPQADIPKPIPDRIGLKLQSVTILPPICTPP
jgi:hypothetical protein